MAYVCRGFLIILQFQRAFTIWVSFSTESQNPFSVWSFGNVVEQTIIIKPFGIWFPRIPCVNKPKHLKRVFGMQAKYYDYDSLCLDLHCCGSSKIHSGSILNLSINFLIKCSHFIYPEYVRILNYLKLLPLLTACVLHTRTSCTHTQPLIRLCVRACVRMYAFFIRSFVRVETSHISVLRWFNFIYILPSRCTFFFLSLLSLHVKSTQSDWQYIGMHRCVCKRYNAHRHQHIHREFSHCRPSCDYTMLTTDGDMGRYGNMVCIFFSYVIFQNRIAKINEWMKFPQ